MRVALAVSFALVAVCVSSPALAQEGQHSDTPVGASQPTGPPGTVNPSNFDAFIESEGATILPGEPATAATDAKRDHAEVNSWDPPCAEWYQDPPAATYSYPPYCRAYWECGGERVDDVFTGDVSGTDATGRYAQFLDLMTALVLPDAAAAPEAGLIDVDSVNDYLLGAGLGDQPSDDALPVFYYCKWSTLDTIEIFPPVGPNGEDLAPRFGWDTTVAAEYDIDGARNDLLVEVRARLGLYNPEPALIPPLEVGYTYVQFPTWLWLENPLEHIHVYIDSDTDTIHIEMRATLDHIDWHFGDDLTLTCSPADMTPYLAGVHDPIADKPACHQRFTQLGAHEVSTTIVYRVEEKISYRLSSLIPYAPQPWVPHPTTPTVELSTAIGTYAVHELIALNVNEDHQP